MSPSRKTLLMAAGARKAAGQRICKILQACWPFIRTCVRRRGETRVSAQLLARMLQARDSNRLLVLLDHRGLSSHGTKRAIRHAHELDRPRLVLDLGEEGDIDRAVPWLSDSHQAQLALCIAGPRESEAPGIYAAATPFLRAVLDRVTLRERENQNAQKQDK